MTMSDRVWRMLSRYCELMWMSGMRSIEQITDRYISLYQKSSHYQIMIIDKFSYWKLWTNCRCWFRFTRRASTSGFGLRLYFCIRYWRCWSSCLRIGFFWRLFGVLFCFCGLSCCDYLFSKSCVRRRFCLFGRRSSESDLRFDFFVAEIHDVLLIELIV